MELFASLTGKLKNSEKKTNEKICAVISRFCLICDRKG